MPIVGPPIPTVGVKTRESWSVTHEQTWHAEALMTYGERVIIRLVWTPEDHAAGLVDRCTVCQGGEDADLQEELAEMYGQTGDSQCEACFGVGFEGGFQEDIHVTYMMAADDPDDRSTSRSGTYLQENPIVQFLWLPELQAGDMVVRANSWVDEETIAVEERRYVIGTVEQQSVRTGVGVSTATGIVIGQIARISPLPKGHAFYDVPLS